MFILQCECLLCSCCVCSCCRCCGRCKLCTDITGLSVKVYFYPLSILADSCTGQCSSRSYSLYDLCICTAVCTKIHIRRCIVSSILFDNRNASCCLRSLLYRCRCWLRCRCCLRCWFWCGGGCCFYNCYGRIFPPCAVTSARPAAKNNIPDFFILIIASFITMLPLYSIAGQLCKSFLWSILYSLLGH